ncbi:MAG TPA: hypothetical protein VFZ64_10485 [Nocardioidaceae bacterium]
MTRGALREPRRTPEPGRTRRELRDVRHPLRPWLRVERVLVCPSGIHVVTSVPAALPGSDPGLVAVARTAADVVAALLPQRYRRWVRAVLSDSSAEPLAEMLEDVLVTTPDTLEHIVRSSPVRLSTSEVHDVVLRLEARLEPFPVVPAVASARRSRRRPLLVAVGLAACAGTVVLVGEAGVLTPPW